MSGHFCKKVRDFISSHHLVGAGGKVIVGLSGGADSVALLLVLDELGFECTATHCNFHLRGEESMRDERFCRELCSKSGIGFVMKDFDVEARRRASGESVEMACRSLRYEWWEDMLREGCGSAVAVGHHEEDNVETFFLNLLRGSGLAGLKGMLPRTGNVIRPLLDCDKDEILAYLNEKGQDYITDSSNLSNDFKRNRLRNVVLPDFGKHFPGMMDAVATSIAHLRDNYDIYTDYTSQLRMKYVGRDGSIDLSRLVTSEKHAAMVLYELLSDVGINMTQVHNILSAMDDHGACSASGKMFHTREISYLLNRGMLIPVDGNSAGQEEKRVELTEYPFSSRKMSAEEFFALRNERRLCQDAIYLDGKVFDGKAEFAMRPWRKGDRMRPFGMKGSRLVSDLFSDAKYSLAQKRDAVILTRNGEILWVVGLRCSGAFAVTKDSRTVYEIRYLNDDKKSDER